MTRCISYLLWCDKLMQNCRHQLIIITCMSHLICSVNQEFGVACWVAVVQTLLSCSQGVSQGCMLLRLWVGWEDLFWGKGSLN